MFVPTVRQRERIGRLQNRLKFSSSILHYVPLLCGRFIEACQLLDTYLSVSVAVSVFLDSAVPTFVQAPSLAHRPLELRILGGLWWGWLDVEKLV